MSFEKVDRRFRIKNVCAVCAVNRIPLAMKDNKLWLQIDVAVEIFQVNSILCKSISSQLDACHS